VKFRPTHARLAALVLGSLSLVLPVFGSPGLRSSNRDSTPQEAAISARFFCHPERVEVGEPFRLILEFSHPLGTSVFDALQSELELDASWVIFGEERKASEPETGDPKRLRTRRAWTIASLEASDTAPRVLSEALSRLEFREDIQRIETSLARIDVASVLGEEDAPRNLSAFPDDFGREIPILERSPWVVYAGVAMAFFWTIFIGLLVRARWRRRSAPSDTLAPLEALLQLAQNPPRELEVKRETLFELTQLLRRSFDARVETQAGLTDREWLAAIRGSKRVPAAALEHVTKLVENAEHYKYADGTPSDWALQEAYSAARSAAETLQATGDALATKVAGAKAAGGAS